MLIGRLMDVRDIRGEQPVVLENRGLLAYCRE
jgi:hypothetical protein